jgi:hypothetical protein
MNGLAENVGYSLAHGCIKLHIGRENSNAMLTDNILHLENGIATMKAEFLCFGSECNNATVIVRENTDGLTLQSRMKNLFYRTEEAVAIYQGIHINDGVCG